MTTLVLPIGALCAIQSALVGYHYPKDGVACGSVIERESLDKHVPLLKSLAGFKRIPGDLCLVEAEGEQIENLLDHMRSRGLTRSKPLIDAATAIGASLCVLDEVRA
jgi:hypothetical protein